MPKKKKKIVWHKKNSKFISPTLLKPHTKSKLEDSKQKVQDIKDKKLHNFAKDLSLKIKKAVRDE
ncbi:MAG: hypothetical protein KAJ18_06705 [Candidatus Omnitrophica bacterium]|nr:hypothetical protein [Candidatus Omnitrophota bacterium]